MKFSILLPTRNRLEYLRLAIESVRRQDYENWEIIVSDNDSVDDIRGFVESLADWRIIYCRTSKFVPVTENWNNALDRASGDFVLMLGDDDGLMPGYLTRMQALMAQHPSVDFAYTGAYFLAYPGVMPDQPNGFLRLDKNGIFSCEPGTAPFLLSREQALQVTQGYLDFRMPVASNMQFSLISRRMIDRMKKKGPFFQSPYPDFYATPALFLLAERILIVPDPMVVIGITPKSYGYFHFNNKADDGTGFLNNKAVLAADDRRMLPGTSYNDSWLLANQALAENWTRDHGLDMNYGRYRTLQIVHCLKHRHFDRDLPAQALGPLVARMTAREKWLVRPAMALGFSALASVPAQVRDAVIARLRRAIGQHAMAEPVEAHVRFADLMDVFDHFSQHTRGPKAELAGAQP